VDFRTTTLAGVVFWGETLFQKDSARWGNPTGGRMLVSWPSTERRSRISPDKRWISFISDRGGGENIWVLPLEGGEPRQVTHRDRRGLYYSTWSPDGKVIAYLSYDTARVALEIVALAGLVHRLGQPPAGAGFGLAQAAGAAGAFDSALLRASAWKRQLRLALAERGRGERSRSRIASARPRRYATDRRPRGAAAVPGTARTAGESSISSAG
jgi:dipeptidyl aminopeptidase/acylaminoacyl peptidase